MRENVPEEDDDEQTWPTEAELREAETVRRKLAPGTSEYQACWITDDEDEGSGSEEPGEAAAMEEGPSGVDALPERAATRAGTVRDTDVRVPVARCCRAKRGKCDQGVTTQEDDAMSEPDDEDAATRDANVRRLREQRLRDAEAEDLDYPDEVEVPPDTPARTRFQKYRGLKSFRTSAWDAKEGLPKVYSRVFAFQNGQRALKRMREYVARAVEVCSRRAAAVCCSAPLRAAQLLTALRAGRGARLRGDGHVRACGSAGRGAGGGGAHLRPRVCEPAGRRAAAGRVRAAAAREQAERGQHGGEEGGVVRCGGREQGGAAVRDWHAHVRRAAHHLQRRVQLW